MKKIILGSILALTMMTENSFATGPSEACNKAIEDLNQTKADFTRFLTEQNYDIKKVSLPERTKKKYKDIYKFPVDIDAVIKRVENINLSIREAYNSTFASGHAVVQEFMDFGALDNPAIKAAVKIETGGPIEYLFDNEWEFWRDGECAYLANNMKKNFETLKATHFPAK